jgi:transcriptional regulator with XRE-family HTH domain
MDKASRREIGRRIKRARQAKELTQSDLAKILGMHRSNFSRIEKGGIMPTAKTLIKIKDILDISIDFLLFGQEIHGKSLELFGEYSKDIREMLKDMLTHRRVKHAVLEFYFTYMEKDIESLKKLKKENDQESNRG